MRIGFDMDGVLCDVDYATCRLIDYQDENNEHIWLWYYKTRKPLLNPETLLTDLDTMIVITARPHYAETVTRNWLSKWVNRPTYLILLGLEACSKDPRLVSTWLKEAAKRKASKIAEQNLDIYFDDSPQIVNALRLLLPTLDCSTKVLQFGGFLE